MTRSAARKLVATCIRNGLAWTSASGYEWFRNFLQPAVRKLSPPTARDNWLMAEAFQFVGDLFWVHDAPMAAIRAYKRSMKAGKTNAETLTEMGDLMFAIGETSKADRCYRRSRAMGPASDSVDSAEAEPHEPQTDPRSLSPPYVRGDLDWETSELLAQSRGRSALSLLRGQKSTPLRQCRAMALGVLGDAEGVLSEWVEISRGDGPVDFRDKDWFYLPTAVWNCSAFWITLKRVCPRISRLGLSFNGLGPDMFGSGLDPRSAERRKVLSCYRRVFEFHLARIHGDTAALQRLHKRYPAWVEIAEVVTVIRASKGVYVPPLSATLKGTSALTVFGLGRH